jgi:hypothetical protein
MISESDLQFKKHLDPRISTCFGIRIDVIDELENASDSIRVNEQSDSKMISESDLQYEKQSDPRISTCLGIRIDVIDEEANAYDSIRVNEQSDSKIISESDLQSEKHLDPRISTCFGIRIDWTLVDDRPSDVIALSEEQFSNQIPESDTQFEKQDASIVVTDPGILSSFTRVPEITKPPTSRKLDAPEMSTDTSNRQLPNDPRPIVSSDFGRNIILNPDPKNDFFSSTRRRDVSVIFTSQSESHSEKLFEQICSTQSGIEICSSPLR